MYLIPCCPVQLAIILTTTIWSSSFLITLLQSEVLKPLSCLYSQQPCFHHTIQSIIPRTPPTSPSPQLPTHTHTYIHTTTSLLPPFPLSGQWKVCIYDGCVTPRRCRYPQWVVTSRYMIINERRDRREQSNLQLHYVTATTVETS